MQTQLVPLKLPAPQPGMSCLLGCCGPAQTRKASGCPSSRALLPAPTPAPQGLLGWQEGAGVSKCVNAPWELNSGGPQSLQG